MYLHTVQYRHSVAGVARSELCLLKTTKNLEMQRYEGMGMCVRIHLAASFRSVVAAHTGPPEQALLGSKMLVVCTVGVDVYRRKVFRYSPTVRV